MVPAAMTPLMPGAGPPPTKMPNLPLLLISLPQNAMQRKNFNFIIGENQPQFAG
jgi:hypothetical protein